MASCPICDATVSPVATRCSECDASFNAPVDPPPPDRHQQREASVSVPVAATRGLGVLAFVGGMMGVAICLTSLYANPRAWLLFTAAMVVYGYGCWCGFTMYKRRPGWLRRNQWMWMVQVPAFASSAVSYWFSSGASFYASVMLSPLQFGVNFFFGSNVSVGIGRPQPPMVGVNLLALGLWIYLMTLPEND
jgi:hypothetical protein